MLAPHFYTMEATPYGPSMRCVLHVDVDAFFCQVETLRNPSLRNMPIAIIQDRDVIAVSYPARQAGVKKYMNPAKARDILQAAGGRLVRVFQEADSRVSYRPYREASAALMRVLRAGLPPPHNLSVQVVEKASIDEAFILVTLPAAIAAGVNAANPVPLTCMQPWVAAHAAFSWDLSAGAAVAAAVRAAVHQQLGLTVSVGVAPNKLLAKLASRQAKPDGVVVIDSVVKVQQLLKDTPVNRIPGLGGSVASALTAAGISHIAQLQPYSHAELAAILAGPQSSAIADRLCEAGWGRDSSQVVEKGPPKSIQVQLALNAHLWRARILSAEEAAAAGGAAAAAPAHLAAAAIAPEALSAGSADTLPRLQSILRAIAGDLLGRVMLDRHSEDRWPKKLAITLGVYTPGQQPKAMSKSTTFPPPTLLNSAPAAAAAAALPADQPPVHHNSNTTQQQQQQQMQSAQSPDKQQQQPPPASAAAVASPPRSRDPSGATFAAPAAGPGPAFAAPGVVGEKSFTAGAALQDRVVQLATGLAQAILSPLAPHQCVGHLNLSVGNFGPFEAAATAGDIRRFTTAAAAVPRQATAAVTDVQVQQEQPQQQIGQQKSGAAASMVEVAAAEKGSRDHDQEQHTFQQQQQQQANNMMPVGEGLKRKRSAEPVGLAGAAATSHITANRPEQHQQPQPTATAHRHQLRPPLPPQGSRQPQVRSAVLSASNIPKQQQHATAVPLRPPVLLSHVLQHLTHGSTTAEAAEQQLDRLLAAAGLTKLLPRQL